MSDVPDEGLTRKQRRELARDVRRARELAERRSAALRRRLVLLGALAAASLVAGVAALLVLGHSSTIARARQNESAPRLSLAPLASLGAFRSPGPAGSIGPEGVPVPNAAPLASAATGATGATLDGIECSGSEQVLFHIHVHLTVFVNGVSRQVPYGIGIPNPQVEATRAGAFVGGGSCFYWLHTHAADGIVHIESPVRRTFTLGDFFDIWKQPLGTSRLGPFNGAVTAIYDRQRYEGDPRSVPLTAHAQIQLEVGHPTVAPETISFPAGL